MRRAPLLAVSLVGVSCAAAGRGGGPCGGSSGARRARPPVPAAASTAATATRAVVVGRGTLGPLPVTKWRLDNGLEVILAPDPGATSVSYTTWFRVGSRHE